MDIFLKQSWSCHQFNQLIIIATKTTTTKSIEPCNAFNRENRIYFRRNKKSKEKLFGFLSFLFDSLFDGSSYLVRKECKIGWTNSLAYAISITIVIRHVHWTYICTLKTDLLLSLAKNENEREGKRERERER